MKRTDYKIFSAGRGIPRAFGRRETPGRAGEKRGFTSRRRNRGTVLIISMWIVIFLAGLVISFSWSSRVDLATTANYVASIQAEATVRSAIRVLNYYAGEMAGEHVDPEHPPGEFVDVGEGFYWFIRPDPYDSGRLAFGITDEASKLNINTATEEMIAMLPGMDEGLAAAIVEWRGRQRSGGGTVVEIDSYMMLPEPYQMKSAPFETIDELLLVQGMTPEILNGDEASPGIRGYITVYSSEPASGETRINVNADDQEPLLELLREIIEDEEEVTQVATRIRRGRTYRNLIDFYLRSQLSEEQFLEIEDRLTTADAEAIPGRINALTASRQVLMCLPGIAEDEVDTIIAARSSGDADPQSILWLAKALPEDRAAAYGDYLTTRSYQFSAEIAAAGRNGRAFQRYYAVVDARGESPRLVYGKNITHQGWPLEVEILNELRAERR